MVGYETNEALLRRAQQGDESAARELVECNLGLVWSVVHRFSGRGYEPEDLFQIGCIGLLKAAKRFDSSFEVKFSTYAVPMIMGEIRRHLRDDGPIKVSRGTKELGLRAMRCCEQLRNEWNREPTLGELAEQLHITTEELLPSLEAVRRPASLNEAVGEKNLTLGDVVPSEDSEERRVGALALQTALGELDQKERALIELRYFKDMTQSKTAALLGMTQVQVSRMERRLLLRLRGMLQEDP